MNVHRRAFAGRVTEPFAFGAARDEPFDVEIDWKPDGHVTVLIRTKAAQSPSGFERHAVQPHAPTWLSVLSSTGELEVQQLQLDRAAP